MVRDKSARHELPVSHSQVLDSETDAIMSGRGTDGIPGDEPITAVCISGGGIRSATFALGFLQGLAKHNLLQRVDYLSTVSGGGYIGAWLTALRHRSNNQDEVAAELVKRTENGTEMHAVQHLRSYSNYLTPRLGITSFDFWTLLSSVLRNMLLNWTVILPLLMAVMLLPRIYATSLAFPEYFYYDELIGPNTTYGIAAMNDIAFHPIVQWVLPTLAVLLFALSCTSTVRYLPGVGSVNHGLREYLLFILIPIILAIWCLDAWNNLFWIGDNYGITPPAFYFVGGGLVYVLTLVFTILTTREILKRPRILLIAPFFATMVPALGAWLIYNSILWEPEDTTEMKWFWAQYVSYSLPFMLISICIGNTLFIGITASKLREGGREWIARSNGGLLAVAAGWFLISFTTLVVPFIAFDFLETLQNESKHLTFAGLLTGVGAGLGAYISTQRETSGEPSRGTSALLARFALLAGIFLFLIILILLLTLLINVMLAGLHDLFLFGCENKNALMEQWHIKQCPIPPDLARLAHDYNWNDQELIIGSSHPMIVISLMLSLYLLSFSLGRVININTFSLQGMYKNRLVRAYLGASRNRDPNAFTDFDPNDDIRLADICAEKRPYHIINMTLNEVGEDRLDWQQRKASSFVASPGFCGNRFLGYRPSSLYGAKQGITLGTAIATSGAAASPNMGYHSSPLISFIMTLFNARLGIWLGNPASRDAWRHSSPRSAFESLIAEGLGLTSSASNYLYLSDGNHFENLGLYEMVQRKCGRIVVLDGGADPDCTLEDLGNALRKIQIDMGIEIRFREGEIKRMTDRNERSAVADVLYSRVDEKLADGQLVYIKPVILGTESPSILSYSAASEEFPHESTGDQWFSETQTESYRLLGMTTFEETLERGGNESDGMRALFAGKRPHVS